MLSATIKRTVKKDPKLLRRVNTEFLPKAVDHLQTAAHDLAPYDKGQLRASFSNKVKGDIGIVSNNAEHAIYNEYGTGTFAEGGGSAYEINSPVKIGSQWRYIGMHQGIKAQPFMRPAAKREKKNLVTLWRQIFRRIYGK